MAESQFLQASFTSGELSPLLKGRTDLNQYYAGLQTAENVVIVALLCHQGLLQTILTILTQALQQRLLLIWALHLRM